MYSYVNTRYKYRDIRANILVFNGWRFNKHINTTKLYLFSYTENYLKYYLEFYSSSL